MTDRALPAHVAARIQGLLEGVSRGELARAAAFASVTYRAAGHSDQAVPDRNAALAYAVVRMPATYAVATRVLDELQALLTRFAPSTCLDIGAGPGTATIAAREVFPGLSRSTLIEPNAAMRDLARQLVSPSVTIETDRIGGGWTARARADLIMASYVLTELAVDEARSLARAAWAATTGVLVLVEPGSVHGWERILAARGELIQAGATILAPCPHDGACPLGDGDWCHFGVRLPRGRDHRVVKAADAPFEDEPFSYVIASRVPPDRGRPARVLRRPAIEKGAVTLQLCTRDGLAEKRVLRRSKSEYKAAKAIEAGDAFEV